MTEPKYPHHIWSGDWEEESRALRDHVEAQERNPGTPGADPPTMEMPPASEQSARSAAGGGIATRRVLATGCVAAALAFGGFIAGGKLLDDGSPTATTAALPAATATTVTPPAGTTQAGAIYTKAGPAVVSIRTGSGSGTGFLIAADGTIVTNAHVVESSDSVTVQFGADGAEIRGQVAGTDPSSDLAVVHIDSSSIPSGVRPLGLADSDKVAVGDTVFAIGNPFGLDRTQTAGIVSGLARDIQAPNGFQISNAIQTDAAINPGNSGGPLLDTTGRVIGVNSQIETSGASSGNVGIGFAVPSNTVRSVVPALKDGRTIERPWLGVSTGDSTGVAGASVGSVVSGSPAQAAGIQPGDVITSISGRAVSGSSQLGTLVEGFKVGDTVTVRVRRDGRTQDIRVTLRARPEQTP